MTRAILALGTIGLVWPHVVPAVPEAGSPPALAALAAGSVFYLLVGLRALGTFAVTRRANDLVLAIGVAWLAAARPATSARRARTRPATPAAETS